MKEIKITSLARFYIMCLLNEGPKHGYELIVSTSKKLGERIGAGHVYPFLKKLQSSGYIAVKKSGAREKKVYNLTRDGRDFVTSMLGKFGDLFELALEPKLTVCAHCGCNVYKGGVKEKRGNRTLAFCCKYCAASYMKGGRIG
ncbi:PadR family transcriptional regulator [Candidatus Micrarchaeota archaeon]|nr:PadR family transcriptional regulator [Candidatus Micrarchaeota archaeon]